MLQGLHQWRNRQGKGQGAQCSAPQTFFTGKFLLTNGDKRLGKKGKWRRKEEKIGREGVICILLFTFWNHRNLFGVYQNGNFYWEKDHFALEKMTLPLLKNIPLMPLASMRNSGAEGAPLMPLACMRNSGAEGAPLMPLACMRNSGAEGAPLMPLACMRNSGAEGALLMPLTCMRNSGAEGAPAPTLSLQ